MTLKLLIKFLNVAKGDIMITLEEACEIAEKHENINLKINCAYDIGIGWYFGFVDRETGDVPDISPTLVLKETGKASTFFPPDHIEEFLNAVKVKLPEKYN